MKRPWDKNQIDNLRLDNDLRERAFGFPARKQLGQNFLVNKEVLLKIAQEINLIPGEKVLEIGPGLGFLTELLISQGAALTAIELDPYCVEAINKLSLTNLTIIEADFLQIDLSPILNEPTKIIGNIPYNITTPIISKLIGEIGQPAPWLKQISSIVLTVQRELAERLVAKPGHKDYSQITLLMNYYGCAEMLFKIGAENFSPQPQVSSAVIKFVPYDKIQVNCKNHMLLRRVIQTGFASRRKMLKNNLRALRIKEDVLTKIFRELNFDPQVRAESLSLELFAKLTDALEKEMVCKQKA
jgi:16S rRNA (adenine1518-N6/adenine1519-N6)-dimethyltransferase